MPTVPVRPSLAPQPVQQARYSAQGTVPVQDQTPRMLGQQAQAFQQAGQDWGRYAAETQRRADIAYTTERMTQAAEADLNEWSAYSQKQGKDAYDGFDSFRSSVQQRYERIAENAENDQQRQWLKEQGQQQVLRLTERAMAHRDKEIAVWRVGSAKAASELAVTRAIDTFGTEDERGALNDVIARSMEQADLQGLDDGSRKLYVDSQLRRVVTGTVGKLLTEPGRTGELVAYWNKNKSVVLPDERTKLEQQVRGAFIDDQTRALHADPSRTFEQKMDVVTGFAAQNVISQDEATRARNFLMQMESQRLQVRAIEERDVRQQLDEWHAQNPMREPPVALQQRAAEFGIRMQRTQVTSREFEAQLNALTPEQVRELRNMPAPIRENYLASGLSKEDAKTWDARILGDQTTVSIAERIKSAALELKVIAPGEMDTAKTEALNAWIKGTVDPAIERERIRLDVDKLTPTQVDELVLDPLRKQMAWVETGVIFKGREDVPVEKLGREGRLGQASVTVDDIKTGRKTDVALRDIPTEHVVGALEEWRKIGQPGSPPPGFVAQYWLDKGSPKASLEAATEAQKREAAKVLQGWPQFTSRPGSGPSRPVGLTPAAGSNAALTVDQYKRLLQQQPK